VNDTAIVSPHHGSRAVPINALERTRKTIPGLDGLRGLAILSVLAFHFSNESGFPLIFKPFHIGWIGVDLFFVLSGFLITGILLDSRQAPQYYYNFYARRALRIFPLYYVFLLVMLGIYLVSGNSFIPHLDRTIHTWPWWVFYGANFLVIRRGWAFPAMGGFWSLAVEEHFYLCWPTVVRYIRPRILPTVIISLVLASFGLRCAAWACGYRNVLFYYTFTLCRLDGLCIGAGLAVIYKNRGLQSIRNWARLSTVAGAVGFIVAILWSRDTSFNGHKMSTFGFFFLDVLCGGILVYAVTADPSSRLYKILNGRTLPFFGKYSYGLYVLHPLVTISTSNLLLPILQRRIHSQIFVPLIFAAWSVILSIALVLLSWNLLEKPALNLKRFFGT
jgi:peptidoglycan/LPS O-acetylase OafA/YrhL